MKDKNSYKPWTKKEPPKKILAIRNQALGDTFIAVSYLQNLRQQMPAGTKIDLLTRSEFYNLPSNLILFDEIFSIKGGHKTRHQYLGLLPLLLKMKWNRYDVVLDLQNNGISNFVRRFINPACYVRFDRFSANHAMRRNRDTINKAGFVQVAEGSDFKIKDPGRGKRILKQHGWTGERLVLLNPGGALPNRNWPLEHYIQLSALLNERYGKEIKFLLLGTERIAGKARALKENLKEQAIVLIDQTKIIDAFAIVQEISLCITEDGGLMHMAYLSAKPAIGILGSSRSDWHDPKLPHTFCFTSDDLECGNCMQMTCKYNTNFCMTRVTAQQVFEKAVEFLDQEK